MWILYSVQMCVGLGCAQVSNCGAGTVSRSTSVGPVLSTGV